MAGNATNETVLRLPLIRNLVEPCAVQLHFTDSNIYMNEKAYSGTSVSLIIFHLSSVKILHIWRKTPKQ